MAELGPGAGRSGDVAALLHKKTTALAPTRDSLIRKGLCYSPRWGEIDFTWLPPGAVQACRTRGTFTPDGSLEVETRTDGVPVRVTGLAMTVTRSPERMSSDGKATAADGVALTAPPAPLSSPVPVTA